MGNGELYTVIAIIVFLFIAAAISKSRNTDYFYEETPTYEEYTIR